MKYVFLFSFFYMSFQLSAQQSFVVTGDDTNTGFGSVNYSVGQVIITSDSTRKGSIMHGVQLPFELFRNPVGINELHDIQAIAYPNPTFDRVKISIPEHHQGPFSLSLISGNGSVIETQTIYESEFILSLTQHSTGMYTILISKENRTVSSFSIIKH